VRVDPKAGLALVKEVVLGQRLPSARLRWYASRILIELDKQQAQAALRQIMLTESSRGVNFDRAEAYPGASIPDQAAFATSGFHNFVQLYLLTEDPKIDETLLMVIGRSEQDMITVKKCIEALSERHSERAVPAIERAYKNPPLRQEDPLFLCLCVKALHEIQGEKARPFLEDALRTTTIESVANCIKNLLGK
ncbi:MAG: HEAT repeat domain-containing protein, partial [Planctomycetota bacterium]